MLLHKVNCRFLKVCINKWCTHNQTENTTSKIITIVLLQDTEIDALDEKNTDMYMYTHTPVLDPKLGSNMLKFGARMKQKKYTLIKEKLENCLLI